MCSNGLAFSVENATVTYHLQFGVPSEDDGFMKYMMSEELVLGLMRQSFHDENVSTCESLGLDPESLLLYGKFGKPRGRTCSDERLGLSALGPCSVSDRGTVHSSTS